MGIIEISPLLNKERLGEVINRKHMTIIYNRQEKKEIRRTLRKKSTKPEQIVWEYVRSKKLGVKFRRQYSVGRYILDFYCVEKRLCIEIDGESHFTNTAEEYDNIRSEYLESVGIKVVRFLNSEVMANIAGVIDSILNHLEKSGKQHL